MFCSKCGYKMPDNANFCPKCGQPVSDFIKNKMEDNCQTDNSEDEPNASFSSQKNIQENIATKKDMPKFLNFRADESDIINCDFKALTILLNVISLEGDFFGTNEITFKMEDGLLSKEFSNKYKYSSDSERRMSYQKELECLKLAADLNVLNQSISYIKRSYKLEKQKEEQETIYLKVDLGINEISFINYDCANSNRVQDNYVCILTKASEAYRELLEEKNKGINLHLESIDEKPNCNGYIFMSEFIKDNIDVFAKYEEAVNNEEN